MKFCLICSDQFDTRSWACPTCGFIPSQIDGYFALAPALAKENSHYTPEAYPELAALEAKNFWFRGRNQLIIWALKKYFPQADRLLEIGCGTGFVLSGIAEAFPESKLTGTDIFCAGLAHAARRVPGAELYQMDARCIPYRDEFDVIGAFDVLEHIEEDGTVLREIFAALRPGGGIAVTVPQHPWLWSRQDEHACHVRRYRTGELREKVLRAGFQVVFETSFVSFLLPAMFVSRLFMYRKNKVSENPPRRGIMFQRDQCSNVNPTDELRLPTMINTAFETVMNVERRIIRLGIRSPWGGSRLLIARRL
uniref:Methyltransferase domain-containing protein n=1 Tax=Candidatus Kentrum sp. SD TaxID=2126332 RepID=A0A451BI79_9GAMM|nr:MAG: Methyltransferase domain-containing protein [Candidatus Kentron sp. SD]